MRWRRLRQRRCPGRGPQLSVDADAVVDVQAGGGRELSVGRNADADDHRVYRNQAAVREPYPVGVAVAASNLGDLHAEAQVDALLSMERREDASDLTAEYPEQRQLGCFENGHRYACFPRGRRHLQADPACSDDSDPACASEQCLDAIAVACAAQVQNTVQVSARQQQLARRGAGGQQQFRVSDAAAVGEDDLVRSGVYPGNCHAEAQVDAASSYHSRGWT